MLRSKIALLATLAACAIAAAPASASEFGPFAPANPYTAANGAATMHGDAAQSDASPNPGPRGNSISVRPTILGAACPTILQGSDGIPIALCTTILERKPTVFQIDPISGLAVASLALPAGENLFGGVYPYLDNKNRVVVADAEGNLLRISHSRNFLGIGKLTIDSSIALAPALSASCPDVCGGVVGLSPDWQGRVWFATAAGVAGFVALDGSVKTIALGSGETVANSIATAPGRTAIATDHALYLLDVSSTGKPRIRWRHAYDRGPSRKPGQLSHGTGATPTFFGPDDGSRYLLITDNAAPAEQLLVFDTVKTSSAELACKIPVLTPGPSGTENSPVGSGRSIFVASTYGYAYPASPAGVADPVPATAPFTGGVTRIDIQQDGKGCDVRWQNGVHSAAVPRLDATNGVLYTVDRVNPLTPDSPGYLDSYWLVGIDAASGKVTQRTLLGASYATETLQLAPTIVPGRILYQGTVTGFFRVQG
jgi:hypothetical protein